jgi:hypothetical protein
MGFTQTGQAQESLVEEVEKGFNYTVEERMKDRRDIETPAVLPGSNAWDKGEIYQIQP